MSKTTSAPYSLSDLHARQEALNPEYSYIVQAPAGSGKTELLTQRFLRLLTTVENPESIIALTFTKKAAREMRDRILSSIEKVNNHQNNAQPETDALAKMVLAQDKKQHWLLLQSPNRLNIQTIDALCSSLVAKMPILSQGAPFTTITEDSAELYQEAARRCLLEGQHQKNNKNTHNNLHYQEATKTLLLHVGNHYNRCVQLLADMLSWREQWLPHLIPAQELSIEKLRMQLENALNNITKEIEKELEELFSDEMKKELLVLMEYSDENTKKNDNYSQSHSGLPERHSRLPERHSRLPERHSRLPERHSREGGNPVDMAQNNTSENKNSPLERSTTNHWKKISNLLLTKDNTWRARIDKSLGFPSPTESKNPAEKDYLKSMKIRLEVILANFRENTHAAEKYRLALENHRHCPPIYYSQNQWEILQALITLLPLLAAQLKTLFMERGETDFSEISEQASRALGELDNPSDLALYLDYSIQHLLIDEFQDTSLKQFRLVERLIEGWQPDDGRTLFIVGDPMQSIYRFREADVSLFLQARESGIGSVALKSLTLDSNFRSCPKLIQWVNDAFQSIFPPKDNLHLSAVTHHPSKVGRQNYSHSGKIGFSSHENAKEQASQIIQKIQSIPTNETIGLLVRSRQQLKYILPQLKEANIAFQGVDIDHLATRPYIQDLYFLTKTLLQPANQLAWLSALRAPWCGLMASDLLILKRNELLSELSEDGKIRFERTHRIIIQARKQRQKFSLATWVEQTWRSLNGPMTVQEKNHADIEFFWHLLDKYSYEDLDIPRHLLKQLNQLYSNTPQKSRLHIMTIHKSKGLEFDHIILPHLEASTGKKDYPLLQHMERRTLFGHNELILATLKSIDSPEDAIYRYLHYVNNKKEIFERQRLLYVALTRARAQIHLFAVQADPERDASGQSFLKWLSSFLPSAEEDRKDCLPRHSREECIEEAITNNELKTGLIRLKIEHFGHHEISEHKIPRSRHCELPPFSKGANHNQTEESSPSSLQEELQKKLIEKQQIIARTNFQITGTFIHERLQYCAENHLTKTNYLSEINTKAWKTRLIELGLYNHEVQEETIKTAHLALNNIYDDPRGQWILSLHPHEKNEYPLSHLDKNFIIDRTFIDQPCINSTNFPEEKSAYLIFENDRHYRWIIDYKISTEKLPSGNLSVDFAPSDYRSQLEQYAQLFCKIDDETNIKKRINSIILALYYPITQTWIAWIYDSMVE